MTLLHWDEARFRLGVLEMDQTHWEFVQLLNNLDLVPAERFPDLFAELIRHTQEHFANEDRLMEESGFPAIREHQGEHRRVLGELHHFEAQLEEGRSAGARAYVREHLPQWFIQHAATMDSALAGHLSRSTRVTAPDTIGNPPAVHSSTIAPSRKTTR